MFAAPQPSAQLNGFTLSVGRVIIEFVEVTARDVTKIPRGNIRVPRADFAALWTVAENRPDKRDDWYGAGVVMTCRWMAGAIVRPDEGRWYPARAPVTSSTRTAYEELIEAELFAAEKLALRRPTPAWLLDRPGWLDAVIATLRWAWRGSGEPPLPFERPAATG